MADIITDSTVADNIAAGLKDVDISGATSLSPAHLTNISGTNEGIATGNDCYKAINSLNQLIDTKAENLSQIADIFAQADAALAAAAS